MCEQLNNGTYIETNIDVGFGGTNSENNNDPPTAKNDDDKGNLKNSPHPSTSH